MTNVEVRAVWSIVRMIVCSVTLSSTVRVSGLFGRLAHRDTGRLGSASMMVTVAPFAASSEARRTAEVDLPAPPFGDANTMVGILKAFR